MGDKPVTTRPALAFVQHLFLRLGDRLDQPLPDPAHEGDHAVEIRASSVQPAAILAHDGQGRHARTVFAGYTPTQKAAVAAFLNSL